MSPVRRHRRVPRGRATSACGALLGACATLAAAGGALAAPPLGDVLAGREPGASVGLGHHGLPWSVSFVGTARYVPDSALVPDAVTTAPGEGEDLLERLRARFSLEVPDEARVRRELDWYRRHPAYLERVFSRAERYLHHIAGELERRGMPAELALLPVVESAYDPFAYSHGRAAGLWQIIPGTGRRFGLRQDWWYDGRRDVAESTRAALDYLEMLARRFDGDWHLAVAAYNSGEGNVGRAIRRNRARGKPLDFWHLRLPRETRAYVPRFLALSRLVGDPAGFGVSLPSIADRAQFEIVDTGGQIDLALAAELAEIDLETLYTFNPGFNRWATAPEGPHRLLVPVTQAEVLRQRLAGLPADERLRWRRHRVAPGETLSHIAARYGVTTATLRSANDLSGHLIREGAHLMIPVASRPLSAYSQSADERLARLQAKPRGEARTEHVVRPGESLWTIGRRYGVGTRALAKWNGMAPGDTLSAGRRLVVWHAAEPAAATPAVAPHATRVRVRKVHYTVRRGDSLSLIAARFRVRVTDIARWNKLNVEKILRPGQRLTMYVDVTRQSS